VHIIIEKYIKIKVLVEEAQIVGEKESTILETSPTINMYIHNHDVVSENAKYRDIMIQSRTRPKMKIVK
jgi:hypothetical protein